MIKYEAKRIADEILAQVDALENTDRKSIATLIAKMLREYAPDSVYKHVLDEIKGE